jgi:6-pyruvoyltetrahydropterin/6-carboxytetrahydropterin synthase
MSARFHVRLTKDSLMFSAGHFITLGEGVCESLHGHDYRVAVEISGPLASNECVVDFLALESALKEILRAWDHQVLLPLGHPQIQLSHDEKEVVATFADRRWVFPRGDCQLLPVSNTTSERLAELIAARIYQACCTRLGARPDRVRVEISESHGQTAACDWQP